jgi:hypothetical protein
MQTVSVGEIAENVKRPGEALQTAIDRVKNWAKEGLIKPVGAKNPGSGRARKYPKSALLDALLIQTFVNSGLAATDAAWVVKQLIRGLQNEGMDPGNSIVLVGQLPGGKRWYRYFPSDDLHKEIIEASPSDTLTIVYVNKIFDRIDEKD